MYISHSGLHEGNNRATIAESYFRIANEEDDW